MPVYWYTEFEDGVPVKEYPEAQIEGIQIIREKLLLLINPVIPVQVNFKVAEREFARFIL